jgi:LysR family carnitine catabolism transcriptional activator
MDFSLRQLRAFVAIARTGSFTAAARDMHLTQPALTVQVRELESALGLRLLDRGPRGVQLTPAGRELLPVLERVLGDIGAVAANARELAAGRRGSVRVAALPSVCASLLPEAMARLARTHPGIEVSLHDAVADRVMSLVRAEEADLGIGAFLHLDRALQFAPLFVDRMVAVLPARHRLAAHRQLTLRQLAAHPLVLTDAHSSVRAAIERALVAERVQARPAYEVTYMSTAVGLVRAGLGIAILPATAFELQGLQRLATRPVAGAAMRRSIGVVRKRGRSLSPAQAAFLEALEGAAGAA